MSGLIQAFGALDRDTAGLLIFFVAGTLGGLGYLVYVLHDRWCKYNEAQLEAVKCSHPGYFEVQKAEKAWAPHLLAVQAIKEHLDRLDRDFAKYSNADAEGPRLILAELAKARADLLKLGLELPRPDYDSMPVQAHLARA